MTFLFSTITKYATRPSSTALGFGKDSEPRWRSNNALISSIFALTTLGEAKEEEEDEEEKEEVEFPRR
jgi:hypothetical protein